MDSAKTLLAAAVLALLAPAAAGGATSEWSKNPQSSVRLITPWQVAPRRGPVVLGLHFRLAPGWHVYWKNSGDAGFPPTVTFAPAGALGKPELLWPTPRRFDLPGGLVAFGYADEVVYPVRATIQPAAVSAAGAAPQEPAKANQPSARAPAEKVLRITADLDYLTCEVDCVPYRYTLTLDQPVSDEPVADAETAPLLQTWLDRLPRRPEAVAELQVGAGLDVSRPGQPRLEIRLVGVTGQPGKTDFFLEPHAALDAGRPEIRVLPGRVSLRVPLKPLVAGHPLPASLDLAWTVSNLRTPDGKSLDLEVKRTVPISTGGAAGRKEAPPPPARLPRLLFWAFLGGLLLNLTPAVLPLLVGETLALRRTAERSREHAAAAATGIVGGCWGIAALSLTAIRTGLPAGWGAALQEPALAALLTVASAVLALNLWGLLDVPLAPADSPPRGTGRDLLAGLFTVPLALSWPMSMLQEPIGYAFGRGPAAVSAVYGAIGVGLALPYLALTLLPALGDRRPAPTGWLPRLREALGFVAGASTFWMLYSLSRQVSSEGLAWIELALLAMALLAWLGSREKAGRAMRLVLVLGAVVCAAGAVWLADRNRLAPKPTELAGAMPAASPGNSITAGIPRGALDPSSNPNSGG